MTKKRTLWLRGSTFTLPDVADASPLREAIENLCAPELIRVDPKKLVPTPDNARVLNKRCAKYKELLASVKAQGVLVPVAARPHPTKPGLYDLRCGERRVAAALDAGLPWVPVMFFNNLTDEQAYELTFTENCHRDDLSPAETGRAVITALAKRSNDVKAVAAQFGRSVEWVRQTAKLRNLSEKWQAALEEGAFPNFTTSHLECVAGYPPEVQDDMHEMPHMWSLCSVTELERELNRRYRRALGKAPFDIQDAKLCPRVGACTTCTKRASMTAKLFKDDHEAEVALKADKCLSPSCWLAKELATAKVLAASLKHDGVSVRYGATDYFSQYNGDEYRAYKKAFGELMDVRDHQVKGNYAPYQIAKKEDKGAIAVLVVHGPGAGKLMYVAKRKKQSVPYEPDAEDLQEQAEEEALGRVTDKLKDAILAAGAPVGGMHALLLVFGASGALDAWGEDGNLFNEPMEYYDQCEKLVSSGEDMSEIWRRVKNNIVTEFCSGVYGLEELRATGKQLWPSLGIDLKAIEKEAAAEVAPLTAAAQKAKRGAKAK